MRISLTLITMLCVSGAGAADLPYAGKANCRVAEHARVAGQQAYWNGACKDGYASGYGALQWSKDGEATERYEGNLSKGVPEGEGIAQWKDGSLYEGRYRDGELHGPAVVMLKGEDKLEASFEHGKPVGNVKVAYGNGDRYEGGWQHAPEGSGTMTFALGGAYQGAWREGKPVGDGEILYSNGQVLKARFDGSFQLKEQAEKPAAPKLYTIKRDARTGSNIRQVFSSGHAVPPEKSYAELTPEQQLFVKGFYKALQDDDVPPYPEKGTMAISRAMGRLISYQGASGPLRVNVHVDEHGVAQSVTLLKSPDSESGKLAAAMLMHVKYTPGRCAGQPCAMAVPFSYTLSVTR